MTFLMVLLSLLLTSTVLTVHGVPSDIPTLFSSCVTYYRTSLSPSALVLVPLGEFIECARTTAMNPLTAYRIAQYAQYAYELHSPRAFFDPSVGERLHWLVGPDIFTEGNTTYARFSSSLQGISELDFHVLVANAFNAAQDYHFGYYLNNILGTSYLSRPVVFGSRWNATSQTQELFVKAPSLSLTYWSRWFSEQSGVVPVPNGVAAETDNFDFNAFATSVQSASSQQSTITSINGMSPISEFFLQYWRSASNMANDQSAFNDLLRMNLNPSITSLPTQYFYGSTQRRWASSAPDLLQFAGKLYQRNTTLTRVPLTEKFRYFDEIVFSDGTVLRIPLLVDIRDTASPQTGCVVSSQRGDGADATDDEQKWVFSSPSAKLLPASLPSRFKSMPETIAMRRSVTVGEDLYRNMAPLSGKVRERTPRSSRRRSDPYVAYNDETPAMVSRRVYASSVANAYFLPAASGSPTDASVMYLRLTSLAAASFSGTYSSIAGAFNALLTAAEPSLAQNLLIDVRDNGGGYVFIMKLIAAIIDFDVFQDNFADYTFADINFQGANRTSSIPIPVASFVGGWNGSYFRNSSMMELSANISAKFAFGGVTAANNPHLNTTNYFTAVGPSFYAAQLNGTSNMTEYPYPYVPLTTNTSSLAFYYSSTAAALGVDFLTPKFTAPTFFDRLLQFDDTWPGWINITLVTDGTCGSACSMLESRLALHLPRSKYQYRSVGFGGAPGASSLPLATSQFTGGSVLSMDCPPQGLRDPNLTRATYRFPGRYEFYLSGTGEYYPITMRFNVYHWLSNPDSDWPRQFLPLYVDTHAYQWDVSVEDVARFVYGGMIDIAAVTSPSSAGAADHASVTLLLLALVLTMHFF